MLIFHHIVQAKIYQNAFRDHFKGYWFGKIPKSLNSLFAIFFTFTGILFVFCYYYVHHTESLRCHEYCKLWIIADNILSVL